MADTHEELQRRIAEDRAQNSNCSYSTLRSSASSWVNGASRAETLTRIIRSCQGQAPVEIYSHQETNDGGNHQQQQQHHQAGQQPALPAPGSGSNPWGELLPVPPPHGGHGGHGGVGGGRDLFASMFEDVLAGVFGGLFGGLGGGGQGGPHAFPFPMPPPAPGGAYSGAVGEGGQPQQPPHAHGRPPAPPHAYPRGGWQPRGGGGGAGGGGGDGGVTEI